MYFSIEVHAEFEVKYQSLIHEGLLLDGVNQKLSAAPNRPTKTMTDPPQRLVAHHHTL